MPELEIRAATDYERLSQEVSATEDLLRDSLFGEPRVAEVMLGYLGDAPAGFALFFHSFSTFLGKRGPLPVGDLFVKEKFRGTGVGRCWATWRGWRRSAATDGSNGVARCGIDPDAPEEAVDHKPLWRTRYPRASVERRAGGSRRNLPPIVEGGWWGGGLLPT